MNLHIKISPHYVFLTVWIELARVLLNRLILVSLSHSLILLLSLISVP